MKAGEAAAVLGETSLFSTLQPSELQDLASRAVRRRYRKGEYVFRQGDAGDALCALVEGRAKVTFTSEDGDTVILATLGPLDTFGELAFVDGGVRSASVQLLTAATVLSLPRSSLLEVLARNPGATQALLRSLGTLVRRMIVQVGDLVFLDINGRVAKLLCGMVDVAAGPRAPSFRLDLTQSEVAGMVGGSRQSVNQALRMFEARGLITTERRTVTIHDLPGLRRRAGVFEP